METDEPHGKRGLFTFKVTGNASKDEWALWLGGLTVVLIYAAIFLALITGSTDVASIAGLGSAIASPIFAWIFARPKKKVKKKHVRRTGDSST